MLWANVPWTERIAGLGGFHKLLVIPLLLAQFRRSERGWLVLYGFLVSCCVLLFASFAGWMLAINVSGKEPGMPVRDYIAQSSEFLICIFALLAFAFDSRRARRVRHAVGRDAAGAAVPREHPDDLDRAYRAGRGAAAASRARVSGCSAGRARSRRCSRPASIAARCLDGVAVPARRASKSR